MVQQFGVLLEQVQVWCTATVYTVSVSTSNTLSFNRSGQIECSFDVSAASRPL
jgi:hypothetical protein